MYVEHFVFPYYMTDLYVSIYLMLILESNDFTAAQNVW